jgi:hypothetical protein
MRNLELDNSRVRELQRLVAQSPQSERALALAREIARDKDLLSRLLHEFESRLAEETPRSSAETKVRDLRLSLARKLVVHVLPTAVELDQCAPGDGPMSYGGDKGEGNGGHGPGLTDFGGLVLAVFFFIFG